MLAEKKTLFRFLAVYLISTFLLLGIGEFFYYQNIKKRILKTEVQKLPPKVQIIVIQDKNLKLFLLKHSKEFQEFKKTLLIFTFFIILFIIFISIILGKIMLKPLKENIKNLENFIRDSTHEMQTPLAIINSNIEMLELKGVKYKEFQRIKIASNRLSNIFNQLKFLNLKQSNPVNLEIDKILKDRLQFFELNGEIEKCNIKIDKEELIRIFDNILSNGKKYHKNYIKVSLKNCVFEVRNDGKIENLKKIKTKFFRENENEGGFGIGLFIVDEICKKYGFKFEITSDKEVKVRVKFK